MKDGVQMWMRHVLLLVGLHMMRDPFRVMSADAGVCEDLAEIGCPMEVDSGIFSRWLWGPRRGHGKLL